MTASHDLLVPVNRTFDLAFGLQFFATGSGGSFVLDFEDSASISFVLPPDLTVTSLNGCGVPEPGTGLALCAGVFGLAWAGRRRGR